MSDPKTLDQALEDDDEPDRDVEDNQFNVTTPVTFREADLETRFSDVPTILEAVPDIFSPDGSRGQDIQQGSEDIINEIQTEFSVDLSQISEVLEESQQTDFGELNNLQLLQVISQNSTIQGQLLQVMADTMVQMLSTMASIDNSVGASETVTVSGSNTIDDANTPQAVIPGSDSTSIPTNKLFLKAGNNNDNPIYLGDDEVDVGGGFSLDAGESITMNIDFRADQIFMVSSEAGEEIEIIGLL